MAGHNMDNNQIYDSCVGNDNIPSLSDEGIPSQHAEFFIAAREETLTKLIVDVYNPLGRNQLDDNFGEIGCQLGNGSRFTARLL